MSFNFFLGAVRDTTLDDLAAVGLGLGDETTVEEASGFEAENLAVAVTGNGLLLVDAMGMSILDVAPQIARRLGREVVTGMFGGVADTYGWTVHDGTGTRREWVVSFGEVAENTGAPLPEESSVETLDEDTLFELIQARTGIAFDLDLPARYIEVPA